MIFRLICEIQHIEIFIVGDAVGVEENEYRKALFTAVRVNAGAIYA
jgi:hypothetical protein